MKCYALVKKVDGKEEILKTTNPSGKVFEFKFKKWVEANEFLKFGFMNEAGVYIKEIDVLKENDEKFSANAYDEIITFGV